MEEVQERDVPAEDAFVAMEVHGVKEAGRRKDHPANIVRQYAVRGKV